MTQFNNPRLKLAFEFVQNTGRNVFLTGKAGTGKTTFLHNLRNTTNKRMVVVAPTGVAAINAGGVTIHSFFQLPFGPQLPNSKIPESKSSIRRFSKEKINIIRSIDLLVIDEISMVRSDLLDGIDGTLRRFRNRNLPFGGVQLLMIGDLQQLPPVVKDDEWNLLKTYYHTPFFFGSSALQQTNYISIELVHVYRQSDQKFIEILNQVRNNRLNTQVIDKLNSRYNPNFNNLGDGHIILTTHNAKAKEVNESRLETLDTNPVAFTAEINGVFPEHLYPNDYELILKEGAQVMFIKNDPDPEKLYYNGKIGKVIELTDESIVVSCDGDEEPIYVKKLFWEKMAYSLDNETQEIKETIEGMFFQYPLKLAWAITIHKSQGLTFENAIIDAHDAFAHGQVYVALSRCKTLEGLVLSSKIIPGSITTDREIDSFNKEVEDNQPDETQLFESKKKFQLDLLLELFDFINIQKLTYYSIKITRDNISSLIADPLHELTTVSRIISEDIVLVSKKFQSQLTHLFEKADNVDTDGEIQDRIKKAGVYFIEKLKLALSVFLNEYQVETDNKSVKKTLKNALDNINNEYLYKLKCLDSCSNGFNTEKFIRDRALASIIDSTTKRKKKISREAATGDENPELYRIIKAWRDAKAEELSIEVYRVIQLKTIRAICKYLPADPESLNSIPGMGKKKMVMYSDELLDIINDYRGEYNITYTAEQASHTKQKKKEPKKETKLITFELFKDGSSIEEIANARELTVNTIEKHISHFIGTGEINISEILSENKISLISEVIFKEKTKKLTEIKDFLGENATYSEIRFTLLYLIFQKKLTF